ncbi:LysR family transcriptional regulator [Sphingomonas mollis]|uniref:LysR family transcriptional regulator n=1 Tax=Sphingomonas mollis TaxID=2795726 RepID=A0ABS0XL86_9SPHN|nr:LysR family transcriptional regulator [Sphingomonas sp. BT553]MBJ6120804.1 LysR family transcriptional regulator [Sphingomonas sp. BT553]
MDADYALFADVVASGSLSAAARVRSISPAMVSKRLARLEARLGVRLIHRTTRKLALTEAGATFHADVTAILQSIRDAEARIAGTPDAPHGPLRISAPTSFGRLHIAPHLPDFLDRHPRVALTLDLTDAFVDLLADRIDLAIRIAPTVPAGLVAHRLATSHRILCAAPRYLDRHAAPTTIADLNDHHLLAADGQWPWRLTDGRRPIAIDGTSHIRTNSSEVVRECAIAGAGIALRSLWDVGDALAAGTLIRILPDWQGPDDLAIHAVHPRAPYVPAVVTAFIGFLQDRLGPTL